MNNTKISAAVMQSFRMSAGGNTYVNSGFHQQFNTKAVSYAKNLGFFAFVVVDNAAVREDTVYVKNQ